MLLKHYFNSIITNSNLKIKKKIFNNSKKRKIRKDQEAGKTKRKMLILILTKEIILKKLCITKEEPTKN